MTENADSECENCGALGALRPAPRWGRLKVCGRCYRGIESNILHADPATLARWDALETESALPPNDSLGRTPPPKTPR